jgi:hypothetical protein
MSRLFFIFFIFFIFFVTGLGENPAIFNFSYLFFFIPFVFFVYFVVQTFKMRIPGENLDSPPVNCESRIHQLIFPSATKNTYMIMF